MKIAANDRFKSIPYLMEVYSQRQTLIGLAIRQFKITYSNATLGVLWAVIQPVVLLTILVVVFDKVADLPSGEDNQSAAAFASIGLIVWMFFSNTVSSSINIALSSREIISKVYFPRIYLVGTALADGLVLLLITVAISIVLNGWSIGLYNLMFIPFLLLLMVVCGIIASVVVMAVLLFPDSRFIFPTIIRLLLFITPIAYRTEVLSEHNFSYLTWLNPLVPLIDLARYSTNGGSIDVSSILLLTLFFLVGAMLILPLFIRFDRKVGDLV